MDDLLLELFELLLLDLVVSVVVFFVLKLVLFVFGKIFCNLFLNNEES